MNLKTGTGEEAKMNVVKVNYFYNQITHLVSVKIIPNYLQEEIKNIAVNSLVSEYVRRVREWLT